MKIALKNEAYWSHVLRYKEIKQGNFYFPPSVLSRGRAIDRDKRYIKLFF